MFLPIAPPAISHQQPAAFVIERIVLPAGFKDSWVVVEYSPNGKAVTGEVTYTIGDSGYLKVEQACPGTWRKVMVKVGDGSFVDAATSLLVQRLHGETTAFAKASGETGSGEFLVFFYGDDKKITDSWRTHTHKGVEVNVVSPH